MKTHHIVKRWIAQLPYWSDANLKERLLSVRATEACLKYLDRDYARLRRAIEAEMQRRENIMRVISRHSVANSRRLFKKHPLTLLRYNTL